jgi:hypothetical protein
VRNAYVCQKANIASKDAKKVFLAHGDKRTNEQEDVAFRQERRNLDRSYSTNAAKLYGQLAQGSNPFTRSSFQSMQPIN